MLKVLWEEVAKKMGNSGRCKVLTVQNDGGFQRKADSDFGVSNSNWMTFVIEGIEALDRSSSMSQSVLRLDISLV